MNTYIYTHCLLSFLPHTLSFFLSTHYYTLLHTPTHSNTLQHTATHSVFLPFYTLLHTPTHSNTSNSCMSTYTFTNVPTHCNTLQHTATHCNTLQDLYVHIHIYKGAVTQTRCVMVQDETCPSSFVLDLIHSHV